MANGARQPAVSNADDTSVRVEIFDDHAIRELMYLGKARSETL